MSALVNGECLFQGKLEDGTRVAVKRLFNSKQVLDEFLKEVRLITAIQHRNLLQLKGCCIRDNHTMLVYEFAVNGSLARTISGRSKHKLSCST